jgi:hypothetical protein
MLLHCGILQRHRNLPGELLLCCCEVKSGRMKHKQERKALKSAFQELRPEPQFVILGFQYKLVI